MNNDEKVKALLSYALMPISSLILLLVDKNASRSMRFHAMQGLFTGISVIVFNKLFRWVFGWIPFFRWPLIFILNLACVALWIMCMVRAYRGEMFVLPLVGDAASSIVDK